MSVGDLVRKFFVQDTVGKVTNRMLKSRICRHRSEKEVYQLLVHQLLDKLDMMYSGRESKSGTLRSMRLNNHGKREWSLRRTRPQ